MPGLNHHVYPGLSLLSEEVILEIHEQSLKLLATTGIKLQSKTARQIFSKSTGSNISNEIVRIPREMIDWAIEKTPACIEIKDRNDKPAFDLKAGEDRNTRFGIGVTNTHYQELITDKTVPYLRHHNMPSVQLGHALSSYDVVSTIGIPNDVPAAAVDLYNSLDLYANTTKPLCLLLLEESSVEQVFEMLAILSNNTTHLSGVLCYVNPITPLILNESTVKKINTAIQYGCPVIYSNYGMFGASTPFDAAGSLALLHAELLAGLVYCQLVKEGSPLILGSLPADFDMGTMSSNYSTKSMLLNMACAEMMAYFKIPHCGTSGSGIGWGADLPASDHLWMNHLTSCLGKAGLAPFVGGNFNSLAFSPAMVVYSDLIIKQVREFIQGFSLDQFLYGLDEIDIIGHGGDFLTSQRTLSQYEKIMEVENLWKGASPEQWQEDGSPKAIARFMDFVKNIMEQLKPPDGYEEFLEKGETFIKDHI